MIILDYIEFIEGHTIECDASHRGGGIKVDVSELFPTIEPENAIMGAYQNYLGGGLLGCIVGGAQFEPKELSAKDQKVFFEVKETIKKYYHNLTNNVGDQWEEMSYEKNQNMPVSGY